MKVTLASEMQGMDRCAIESYGIPGIILMENAALRVLEVLLDIEEKWSGATNKPIAILCGTGNNGGDGFVLARHLINAGRKVYLALVGSPESIRGDARINYDILLAMKEKDNSYNSLFNMEIIDSVASSKQWVDDLSHVNILVDALFGTGLTRAIEGYRKSVIEEINARQHLKCLAIDIPSGVSADSGQVLGTALKAKWTVSFALPKPGLYLYPGANYAGDLYIKDIGIPKAVMTNPEVEGNVLTGEEASSLLPKRVPWSNKGTYGKVGILAGSKEMTGAAILSGKAAYRGGTGLVKMIVPSEILPIVQNGLIESVCLSYDKKNNALTEESKEKIITGIKELDVLVIGPGLGQSDITKDLMEMILDKFRGPLIIDADGLNVISNHQTLRSKFIHHPHTMITPHIGEMSRLTGLTIEEIKKNPIKVSQCYAREHNTFIALKDARTIVAAASGQFYINTTGHNGMSTAGVGDVLTGVIASLIAQGLNSYEAMVAGVYYHGKAGEQALSQHSQYGIMASDLCEHLW